MYLTSELCSDHSSPSVFFVFDWIRNLHFKLTIAVNDNNTVTNPLALTENSILCRINLEYMTQSLRHSYIIMHITSCVRLMNDRNYHTTKLLCRATTEYAWQVILNVIYIQKYGLTQWIWYARRKSYTGYRVIARESMTLSCCWKTIMYSSQDFVE